MAVEPVTNNAIDDFYKLAFPYSSKRFADVKDKGLKMAHYTTAQSAALILRNKTLWLRNAALMNDFSEIAYGTACLERALQSGLELRLETAVESVYPALFAEVKQWLHEMDGVTRQQTYLTSVSAHHPDNHLGKLSMWRAYGGPTSGVALIFNTEVFEHESDTLGAYSSPVLYGDWNELAAELEAVVSNVENNLNLIQQVPAHNVKSILFNTLQFCILSTKHPAFQEEEEWRVIHSPITEASAFIKTSIQTINGIPQMVCEVPLTNQPGLNMPWMNLDQLLHKIIIGPCVYPDQVAWAFAEILREAGIANPYDRITIARIPLRQQG